MPFGLINTTRPFDCKLPRMADGFAPTTRFNTALDADCWIKRVISPALTEKPCQLMMVPGEFVMLSALPLCTNPACPRTTSAPVGFATTADDSSVAKQDATVSATKLVREGQRSMSRSAF